MRVSFSKMVQMSQVFFVNFVNFSLFFNLSCPSLKMSHPCLCALNIPGTLILIYKYEATHGVLHKCILPKVLHSLLISFIQGSKQGLHISQSHCVLVLHSVY